MDYVIIETLLTARFDVTADGDTELRMKVAFSFIRCECYSQTVISQHNDLIIILSSKIYVHNQYGIIKQFQHRIMGK